MCAECMYATVLDVCMYAEYRKKYTILNSCARTGCSCLDKLIKKLL